MAKQTKYRDLITGGRVVQSPYFALRLRNEKKPVSQLVDIPVWGFDFLDGVNKEDYTVTTARIAVESSMTLMPEYILDRLKPGMIRYDNVYVIKSVIATKKAVSLQIYEEALNPFEISFDLQKGHTLLGPMPKLRVIGGGNMLGVKVELQIMRRKDNAVTPIYGFGFDERSIPLRIWARRSSFSVFKDRNPPVSQHNIPSFSFIPLSNKRMSFQFNALVEHVSVVYYEAAKVQSSFKNGRRILSVDQYWDATNHTFTISGVNSRVYVSVIAHAVTDCKKEPKGSNRVLVGHAVGQSPADYCAKAEFFNDNIASAVEQFGSGTRLNDNAPKLTLVRSLYSKPVKYKGVDDDGTKCEFTYPDTVAEIDYGREYSYDYYESATGTDVNAFIPGLADLIQSIRVN